MKIMQELPEVSLSIMCSVVTCYVRPAACHLKATHRNIIRR